MLASRPLPLLNYFTGPIVLYALYLCAVMYCACMDLTVLYQLEPSTLCARIIHIHYCYKDDNGTDAAL